MIVIENFNFSTNLGRITIAYIRNQGVIRVVHSVTGECLKQEPCGDLNIPAFRAIVNRYKHLINETV